MRTLGPRPGRGVVVDEELHACRVCSRRPDDAADDAGRRHHGHICLDAVSRTAAYGQRGHAGIRIARNHVRRNRRQRSRRLQVQELLQPHRPRGKPALLLEPDLRLGQLPAERLIFRTHAAEPDVIAPEIPNPVERSSRSSLHTCECAERDGLKHRHSRFRLHLRRDQDQLCRDDDEQQHSGTAANV
jgi:hypothetical protein